jgi:hypothetical protein
VFFSEVEPDSDKQAGVCRTPADGYRRRPMA